MIEWKKNGRPTKRPSEAELSMLYSQMTAKELAERYSVTEQTVRRWISFYRKEGDKKIATKIK